METEERTIINGVLNKIGTKFCTDKAIWHKYCDFYEKHLPPRSFTGRLLELGVWDGASIRMWREYYPLASIVGVDISIRPRDIENVVLIEMDSSDDKSLSKLGKFDIIIDDASHMCSHQQIAFAQLYYNQLNKGGLYVMEDAQTSFYDQYKDTDVTTYDMLKEFDGAIEFNREGLNESISIIIPKQ